MEVEEILSARDRKVERKKGGRRDSPEDLERLLSDLVMSGRVHQELGTEGEEKLAGSRRDP